jgi:hypothetical protein
VGQLLRRGIGGREVNLINFVPLINTHNQAAKSGHLRVPRNVSSARYRSPRGGREEKSLRLRPGALRLDYGYSTAGLTPSPSPLR